MKRVVVTGMGAVTPIGLNVNEYWNSLKEGKTGFGEVTYFDTTEYKAHLAAELKGFDAKNYMDFKAAKRMAAFSQYAVAATKEALEASGLDMEKEDPFRVESAYGSSYDLEYGCRKCVYPVWASGKKYQCSYRLCHRYPQHWRGLQKYPVRRCRCYGGRGNRGCHHSCRIGGLFRADRFIYIHGSKTLLHSF